MTSFEDSSISHHSVTLAVQLVHPNLSNDLVCCYCNDKKTSAVPDLYWFISVPLEVFLFSAVPAFNLNNCPFISKINQAVVHLPNTVLDAGHFPALILEAWSMQSPLYAALLRSRIHFFLLVGNSLRLVFTPTYNSETNGFESWSYSIAFLGAQRGFPTEPSLQLKTSQRTN